MEAKGRALYHGVWILISMPKCSKLEFLLVFSRMCFFPSSLQRIIICKYRFCSNSLSHLQLSPLLCERKGDFSYTYSFSFKSGTSLRKQHSPSKTIHLSAGHLELKDSKKYLTSRRESDRKLLEFSIYPIFVITGA